MAIKKMPLHPCVGCVYYKVCGESTRTVPCMGRVTKSEKEKEKEKKWKKNRD